MVAKDKRAKKARPVAKKPTPRKPAKKPRAADAPLTSKQVRYLRGLGHALEPIVHVGKEGVTGGLSDALAIALRDHELVKVKVLEAAPEGRHGVAEEAARRTGSQLVQVLGRAILLYKAHPDEPQIKLPS